MSTGAMLAKYLAKAGALKDEAKFAIKGGLRSAAGHLGDFAESPEGGLTLGLGTLGAASAYGLSREHGKEEEEKQMRMALEKYNAMQGG